MSVELIHLTETLSLVVGQNRGRFPYAHAFLVQDKVCALIDSGCGFDILRRIKESFSIDLVINSHGHPDHCCGNWLFPDAPLYVPKEGADTHGRIVPLSHRFLGRGPLADHWQSWIRQITGFADRTPTHFFSDGHVFDFGRLKLTALHTPGHTADHYCFFEPKDRILLSFDVDLTSFGPWYGNLESNLSQFKRSIELVRHMGPRLVASSHLHPITDGIELAFQGYAAVFDRRRQAIIDLISRGADRAGLGKAAPIYGRHSFAPEFLAFFEGRMIDLHLQELAAEGLIRQQGERYHLTSPALAASREPSRCAAER